LNCPFEGFEMRLDFGCVELKIKYN
jgi:hypothetical protein